MIMRATAGSIDAEDGVYPATWLSIEIVENPESQFDQKEYLRWKFHVYHNEEGSELTANSSMAFGPKAKGRKWMEAILRRPIETGEEIDPEEHAPKDCQVVIKKDPESGFVRINDVLPERKHPGAAKAKGAGGVAV